MDTQPLIALEERLAHLEAAVDVVTDTLLARERELREAWLAIEHLRSQLASLSTSSVGDASREPPPPHY